jgi:hypothetical protein
MPKPHREGEKSSWETAGLRIGVISGAIGLAISVVGLPKSIADALKREDSAGAQLQQKRAEAAAAGPRLELKYLFLSTEVLSDQANTKPRSKDAGRIATLASSSPVVANEVMIETDIDSLFGAGHGCRYAAYPSTSIAFLEIDNRGRRDAANVAVVLDHYKMGSIARIREADPGGDDYVARIRGHAMATTRVTVRIPRTLGPGDGVRIPLFVSDAPYQRYDLWCVASRTAYLPRSLSFTDPAFGTTTRSPVRRMQSPLVIGRGAFERG